MINEKEQIEVIPVNEDTKNADCDKESPNSFGKFKSKEELIEAYANLTKEFTRKSQRLKEIEAQNKRLEEDRKWDFKVKELNTKYPIAKEYEAEIASFLERDKALLKDEGCLEKALLSVLSEGISKKREAKKEASTSIDMAEYIKKLNDTVPVMPSLSGEIPINAPYRPKTIAEAGELARSLFKK